MDKEHKFRFEYKKIVNLIFKLFKISLQKYDKFDFQTVQDKFAIMFWVV